MQELPVESDVGAVERRRAGELTPHERAVRRKNRRWMAAIAIPALILGAIALVAAIELGSGGSSVRPVSVPAGYRAITDEYFAYAIPTTWSENDAFTDDVGDLDHQGPSGWAAEHLGARTSPPVAGEVPPSSFAVFGQTEAVPYSMSPPTPITVRGATVAYRYTLSRPQGFRAIAIDAWQANSDAELWLLVHADPANTTEVINSLSG